MDLSKIKFFLTGLLFLFIDINIGGFDFVPDVIGGIILIIAFIKYRSQSKYFRNGLISAFIITIFSVIELFNLFDYGYIGLALGLINFGYLIYCIFSGFSDLALQINDNILSTEILSKRGIFVIITMICLAGTFFGGVLAVISSLAGVAIYIYILILFNKFSKKLEAENIIFQANLKDQSSAEEYESHVDEDNSNI